MHLLPARLAPIALVSVVASNGVANLRETAKPPDVEMDQADRLLEITAQDGLRRVSGMFMRGARGNLKCGNSDLLDPLRMPTWSCRGLLPLL